MDDTRPATDVAKKHGAQILSGPMQVPGGGWISMGIDPQGALFAVHSVAPAASTKKPAAAKRPAGTKTPRTATKKKTTKKGTKKKAAKKNAAKEEKAAPRRAKRKAVSKK